MSVPLSRFIFPAWLAFPWILAANEPLPVEVKLLEDQEGVGMVAVFQTGEREIVRYQGKPGKKLPREGIEEAFRRGGYLHPLTTPTGVVVTDDYPVKHTHHHGVWAPWTKTSYQGREPDFWNMGKRTGRVEASEMAPTLVAGKPPKLQAKHQFIDMTVDPEITVLDESWQIQAQAFGGAQPRHVVDLTSVQTIVGNDPLILPPHHYGGLGFRGREEWDGKENCLFLTSEGITDRVSGNESRARWVWVGGKMAEGIAGVTILCHPENVRFPQPLRLHPDEPFACFAPQQLGEMSIQPGQPYTSRYRFVVTDGPVDQAMAEAWWQEWVNE